MPRDVCGGIWTKAPARTFFFSVPSVLLPLSRNTAQPPWAPCARTALGPRRIRRLPPSAPGREQSPAQNAILRYRNFRLDVLQEGVRNHTLLSPVEHVSPIDKQRDHKMCSLAARVLPKNTMPPSGTANVVSKENVGPELLKTRRPRYAAARRRDWERLWRTQRMIDAMLPMTHNAVNPSMNQANSDEFAIRRISRFSQIAPSPTKENRTARAPKTTPRRRSLGYWSALAAATIAVNGNGGGAKQA
jgi:hypothetical protein